MKKLAYLAGLGCALCMLYACEDEPKNPGRFDQAAELSLGDKVASLSDTAVSYVLELAEQRDTVYAREHIINDTVFRYLENGDSTYEYGADGKVLVNQRTVIVYSKKTAKLLEYKPVILPSYADTMEFKVYSNARWMANNPIASKWLENYEGTFQGGGDSRIKLISGRNRKTLRGPVNQYVYTSDSLVCAKIPFYQEGERDK